MGLVLLPSDGAGNTLPDEKRLTPLGRSLAPGYETTMPKFSGSVSEEGHPT